MNCIKHNKAAIMVFNRPETPFERLAVPIPNPEIGELIVKIRYTTICTSDLHTYYARRQSPCPTVLGHEIIGEITAMGGKIVDYHNKPLHIGDLITWTIYAFDPSDPMSIRGFPQKSAGLYKYGHQKKTSQESLSGGFASHCHLKKGTTLFKLPQCLSYQEAAPLNCTHATIAGAIRLAGNLVGKNVCVFGAGMLGISACAMAKQAGASTVFSVDLNAKRSNNSLKFGATKAFTNIEEETICREIAKYERIDVVIDTTGVAQVMEKGLELLSIGGIAIWVGAVYSERKTKFDAETIVRKLLTIKGLHNYIPDDLAYAINFLTKNHAKYPFKDLIGATFSLSELNTAFEAANLGQYYRVGISQE